MRLPSPSLPAFHLSSVVLALAALLGVLLFNLLVALLAVCGAFALAMHLPHTWPLRKAGRHAHLLATLAVAAVPVLVFIAVGLALSYLSSHATVAYAEVVEQLTALTAEWRGKLPAALAAHLPDGPETIKPWLASLVQSQADTLASAGKSGAHGLLMAFIGVVIGLLLANAAKRDATARNANPELPGPLPLAAQLRLRARQVQDTFEKVVLAQLWIAGINTVFTAIFFYLVLPLMGAQMPYAPSLLLLTFFAGLLPVVGNLVCNTVTTMVALTVGPVVAVSALLFLVLIHKAEYFINAKVVGARMSMQAWELLTAMFVFEAVFGVAGLVAAPLFYPYLKLELRRVGWA
jgi:predicted PurR-regulated permease PerM